MKKFLSLVLALIMAFSVVTVAFATDTSEVEPDTTTTAASSEDAEGAGSLDWLLDLPVWTLKPGSKVLKIALKLVKVVVKIAMAFGIIDAGDIIDQIMGMINGNTNTPDNGDTTTAAPETTAAAAA